MRVRIAQHRVGCRPARELAEGLGGRRLYASTRFAPRVGDVIINWGCGEDTFPLRQLGPAKLFNPPAAVSMTVNKTAAYEEFSRHGVPCPDFTTDINTAKEWTNDGNTVVARTLTRASSGRGIVVCSGSDDLPRAPLYTKYRKKRDEYRVHVANGRVLHTQHKRRRRDFDGDINYAVRNVEGGWVYCIENVSAPKCVLAAATSALLAVGLDFGAVDIGYNVRYDEPCVYEINTAPNLEGTTLDKYVDYFKEELEL